MAWQPFCQTLHLATQHIYKCLNTGCWENILAWLISFCACCPLLDGINSLFLRLRSCGHCFLVKPCYRMQTSHTAPATSTLFVQETGGPQEIRQNSSQGAHRIPDPHQDAEQVHTPMALYAPERTCHPTRLATRRVATTQQTDDIEAPSERTNQASSRTSDQPSKHSVSQSVTCDKCLSVSQCASFTQKMLLLMVVLLCRRKCCPTRFRPWLKGVATDWETQNQTENSKLALAAEKGSEAGQIVPPQFDMCAIFTIQNWPDL